MSITWNTTHLNLQNLIDLSKGDSDRILKYLLQFQELMPGRIENLKKELSENNRVKIRQILHSMSPQLQFFEIPNVTIPINRMEHEYNTLERKELESMVENILIQLEGATEEINNIIKENFG